MTICIAAICTIDDDYSAIFNCYPVQEVIIGISDRMVSSDFAQAEFPLPKYSKVVGSIVVSSSGSASVHWDILEKTKSHIQNNFENDPRTIPVKEIARLYSQNLVSYIEERRDKIANKWVGLNYTEYLMQKHQFKLDDRGGLSEIKNIPAVIAIVTGIDSEGPHVYQIEEDGSIKYEDEYGLSIIGSGSQLADYEFSTKIQTRKSSFSETLIHTYMAKKRAELDPFVGKDTDIFLISNDHSVNVLSDESIKRLDDLFNKIRSKQNEAIKEAGNTMASFLRDGKMELI